MLLEIEDGRTGQLMLVVQWVLHDGTAGQLHTSLSRTTVASEMYI